MATAIVMPKVGQSVESCMLTEWCKKPGDPVQAGEVLFRFETDKSAFDEEAKENGTLLATFFQEGDDIPCLTNIGVIGQPGEQTDPFRPQMCRAIPETQAEEAAMPEPVQAEQTAIAGLPSEGEAGRQACSASPRARRLAEKLGVNYRDARPTGPDGRIVEADIRRLAAASGGTTRGAAPKLASGCAVQGTGIGGRFTSDDTMKRCVMEQGKEDIGYTDVKFNGIRRTTAKAMTSSLSTMAQLTHTTSFDASVILELRRQIKEMRDVWQTADITVNDMILFAVSRVLLQHPDLNSHLLDDTLRRFHHVHLGIAVDTPRGLLVPTLFDADQKSLGQIAQESKELVAACREGSIGPDQMKGASFTVSNLGAFGIEHFTPIINPPQTGILGVDCTVDRVRTVNGALSVYPAMGLSLTYDHRALDGAPASRFLMDLKKTLEHFDAILI